MVINGLLRESEIQKISDSASEKWLKIIIAKVRGLITQTEYDELTSKILLDVKNQVKKILDSTT